MKIAVVFDNFGPYHLARLKAAASVCTLLGVEVAGRSAEYDWAPNMEAQGFQRTVLVRDRAKTAVAPKTLSQRLSEALSGFRPDTVAIPGWSGIEAFLPFQWCMRNRVPLILMSESQAIDGPRRFFTEWIKSRYIANCQAALVGGESHREYLVHLGMARSRVYLGYDVVDNDHFICGSDRARGNARHLRTTLKLPERYFLACARFVPKKNLATLVSAFAQYVKTFAGIPHELVILGDGPLRQSITNLAADLGVGNRVHLPGFMQYDVLPAYYGLAHAFIHASSIEQWGLVVNEAMASRLPVIVSKRCGCAADLVRHGDTGYVIEPFDASGLAAWLTRLSQDLEAAEAVGRAGRERILQWGPGLFAAGLRLAADCAVGRQHRSGRWFDPLLANALQHWHRR